MENMLANFRYAGKIQALILIQKIFFMVKTVL